MKGRALIRYLYRYPVKGLSGEPLERVRLETGRGIPIDRSMAIARRPGNFDPAAPRAVSKDKFLMLMRDEALARLTSRYDEEQRRLRIVENGITRLSVSLADEAGRSRLAAFMKDFVGDAGLQPVVVEAPDHQFTDISVVSPEKMRAVSLINLASVKALSEAIGKPVDHRRFRANIYFDGVPAWRELDWLDREITIGACRLKVTMRTRRCAATQVNPDTAERDINVPAEIKRYFGHFDMGVYAEVMDGGDVAVGDVMNSCGGQQGNP